MIATLAVLKAGADYVPLDPPLPTAVLREQVLHTTPVLIVAPAHCLAGSASLPLIVHLGFHRQTQGRNCKGPMHVIGLIEDRAVVRAILTHLGRWQPKAVERAPARALRRLARAYELAAHLPSSARHRLNEANPGGIRHNAELRTPRTNPAQARHDGHEPAANG